MEHLSRPDGRIAYDVTGTGPLIVCVHGIGDSHAAFRHLTPRLADLGFRVAAMDVRGYGESSAVWPDYSVAATGADVLALVHELGGPAVVVGHSLGCAAAVWAAADDPDAVNGLVLISSSSGDQPPKAWLRALAGFVGRSAQLWTVFLRTNYPAKPNDLDAYLRGVKSNLREPGRRDALRGHISVAMAGPPLRYREVRCPTLLIFATKDSEITDPIAEAARITAKLTASTTPIAVTTEIIEGAGHYPQAAMPQPTAAAIAEFLEAVPRL